MHRIQLKSSTSLIFELNYIGIERRWIKIRSISTAGMNHDDPCFSVLKRIRSNSKSDPNPVKFHSIQLQSSLGLDFTGFQLSRSLAEPIGIRIW